MELGKIKLNKTIRGREEERKTNFADITNSKTIKAEIHKPIFKIYLN